MAARGTALVTGASGALGAAMVECLIERGYRVVGPLFGASVPPHLTALPDASFTPGIDLSDEAKVTEYFASVPPFTFAFNIAGGFLFKPVAETSAEDVLTQFRLNALSCFLSAREESAVIARAGGGAIVNITARSALRPELGASMTGYTMAKAGVAALTQALAAELKGQGVRVNALAPSMIDTPANRAAMPDADPSQWVSPAAVARLAWALAENDRISGAVVPIYGDA